MNKYGWLANTHQTVAWVPADDRAWRRYGTVQVDAVIPPEIASVVFAIPAELAASIGRADAALARLDVELNGVNPHALDAASAHLLRAESLSSSRIEGLDLSARKLAEAEFDPATAKCLAREVAANVRAMQHAVELGSGRRRMIAQDVADLHAVLMADVPAIAPGLFRTVQNWIGPTNNPNDAVFVPPPPAELPRLIEDLAAFTNRTDLSPTIQAAIAHAQFEGIHPFVDGNGRVGRCLVGVIIRRRCGIGGVPAGLRGVAPRHERLLRRSSRLPAGLEPVAVGSPVRRRHRRCLRDRLPADRRCRSPSKRLARASRAAASELDRRPDH